MEESENAYFYLNKTNVDSFKDVCTTCLSRSRTLYYTVQHQRSVLLTLGIQVENDQKLCWECCAIVKNIIRFQYKALYAKIIYNSQNLRQLNNVGSMSRLKKTKPFRLCTIFKHESCYDPLVQSGKNGPDVEKLYNSRWKVLPEASKIKCQTIASGVHESERPTMKSQLITTLELPRPQKSVVPAVHYKTPRTEFISCGALNKDALSKKQDVATNNTREPLILFDKKLKNFFPNNKRKKIKLVLKSNQISFTDLRLNAHEEKAFPIVSKTSSNVLHKNNSKEVVVPHDPPETHCNVDNSNSKLIYELCTDELQRIKDYMAGQEVGIKHNTYNDNPTFLDETVDNTKTSTMNTDENTPKEEPTIELHTVDKELKNNCLTEIDDNAALSFNDMTIIEIDDSNSVTETDEDKYVTKADEGKNNTEEDNTLPVEDNHISDIHEDINVCVIIGAENVTEKCEDSILKGMDNIERNTEDENLTLIDNVTDVNKCVTKIDLTENNTDIYENTNTLSNKKCEDSIVKGMGSIEKNTEVGNVSLTDNVTVVNTFVTMIEYTENNTDVYENTNTLSKRNETCEDSIVKGMGNIEKNTEVGNVSLTDNVTVVNTFVTMIDYTENNTDVYENTNTLPNKKCEDSFVKGMDNIEKHTEDDLTLTDNVTHVNKFVTMIDYTENNTDVYENTNTLPNKKCEDSFVKGMDNIEKHTEDDLTLTDNVTHVNKFDTMIDYTENNTDVYENTNTLPNKKCEDSFVKGMDNIEKHTEDDLTLTDNVTHVNKFVTMIDYTENNTDVYENTNTLPNKKCEDSFVKGMDNIEKHTEDDLTLPDNVTHVNKFVTMIDYTENNTDVYENTNTLPNKKCEDSFVKGMDNIEKHTEDDLTLPDNVTHVSKFVTMIDLTENNTDVYENTNTLSNKKCEDSIVKGMGNIEKNTEVGNVSLTDNVTVVNTIVTMIDYTENNTDVYENTNTLSKRIETCEDSIVKGMDNIEKHTEDDFTLTDNVTDINKCVTMIDFENNTDVYENTNTLSKRNETCEDSIVKGMDNIEKNTEVDNVTLTDNVNKFVTMVDYSENNTDVYENTDKLLKNAENVLSDEDKSVTMIHNIENGAETYENNRTLSEEHNSITLPAQSEKENTSAINLPVLSSNVLESENNILSLMCLEELHLSDESIGSRNEEITELIAIQPQGQDENMGNTGTGDGKQMSIYKKKQIVNKTNKASKNKKRCIDKCLTKKHNVTEIGKITNVTESDKGNNKPIWCENKRFSKFKYDDYTVMIRNDQEVTVISDSNNIPITDGEINSSKCYTETRPQSNKSTVQDIRSDNKGDIDRAHLALDTNKVNSNTESNTEFHKKNQNKHIKGVQELVVHRVTAEGTSNFKINLPNLCDEAGVQIPIHLIEKTTQNTSTSSIAKMNKAIKSNSRTTKTKKNTKTQIKKDANKSLDLSYQVLLKTILMDHCYCFNSRHMILDLKKQSKSKEAMKNNLRFKIVQKDTGKIRFMKTAPKLNTVEKLSRSRYVQNIIDDFEKEEADTSAIHGLENENTHSGIEKNMMQGVSSIPRGKSYDMKNLNPMEEANDYAILTDVKVEVYDPEPAECNNESDDSFDWCVQRYEKESERIHIRPETSFNEGCTTTDNNSETKSVGSITEYFGNYNSSNEEYGNSHVGESDSNYNYYQIKPSECEDYYEPRNYENDSYEVQPCKETISNYPTDFEMNNITVTFSSSLFNDDLKNTSAELGDEIANDQSAEANICNFEMRNTSPDLLEPLYFEPWEDNTFDHAVSNNQTGTSGSVKNKEYNEHEKNIDKNQLEVPYPTKRKRKQSDLLNIMITDEKTAQNESHKGLLGSISKRLKQNLTECKDKNKEKNINCDKLLQLPIVVLEKISVDELREKVGKRDRNGHMLKEPLHKHISTNTITDLVKLRDKVGKRDMNGHMLKEPLHKNISTNTITDLVKLRDKVGKRDRNGHMLKEPLHKHISTNTITDLVKLRDKVGKRDRNGHMLKEPLHKNISTNTITDLVEPNKELTDDPDETNDLDGWLTSTDSNKVIETNSDELWGSWFTITNVKHFNNDTTSSTKIDTRSRRSKRANKVRQSNSCQNKNRDQIAKAATDHFNAMKKLKTYRTGAIILLKSNDIFTLRLIQDGELEHVRKKARFEQEYKNARSKCVKCIMKCPYERHFARYHEESVGDFVCEICECRFKDEVQFIKHTESHKSVYRCRWCSEEYLFFNVLLSHVKLVHSENRKLYTCKVCQKTYFNHVSLWTHQKTHIKSKTKNTKYVTRSTTGNPRATAENLSLTGDNLNLTGDNLNLTGDKLNLTGDNLNLTGDNLNLTGDNLNLTDKNSSLLNNDVNLTEKRSKTRSDEKLGNRKTKPIRRRTDVAKLHTEESQKKTFLCLRCNRRYQTADSWWKHRTMFHNRVTTTENTNKTGNSSSLTDNNSNLNQENLTLTENNSKLNQENLTLTENNSKLTGNSNPEPVTGISAAKFKPVIFGKIRPKKRMHVCKICRKRCKTAGSLAQHKRHIHKGKNTVNNTNSTETGPNLAGDNLSLAGDNLSLINDNLSLAADNLSLANDSSLANDDLSLANDNSSLANDNSSLANDNSSLDNDNSSLDNDNSSLANDNSSLANDIISLTNDNFSLTDNNLKVTENVTQYKQHLNENTNTEINRDITVEDTNVSPVKVEQERILHECMICHKQCKTRGSLMLHQKFTHNKIIHNCMICHKICKTHAALVLHQKCHNKRSTDKNTYSNETELVLSDNILNLTDNLSVTDNNSSLTDNLSLTDNNLSLTDNNLSLTKYVTQCDPQSEQFNESSSTAEINPNVTDEVIQASVEDKRRRSLYECVICHKKCKTRGSLGLHQKFSHNKIIHNCMICHKICKTHAALVLHQKCHHKRSTDTNTNSNETELNLSDNNLNLTDNLSVTDNNSSLTDNLSLTDNNLSLTDNNLSLTKYVTQCDPRSEQFNESSSTAEINPNITDEVIQASVEDKPRRKIRCPTCQNRFKSRKGLRIHIKHKHHTEQTLETTSLTDINLSFCNLSLSDKDLNSTEHNSSLTENNLSLTDNNLSLTKNYLSVTNKKLSLRENKLSSANDNLCLTVSDVALTENNISLTEEKSSLPHNHIIPTDHTLSSNENNFRYLEKNSNLSNDSLKDDKLSLMDNNLSLTENNLNPMGSNVNLTENTLTLTDNTFNFTDNDLTDNYSMKDSTVILTDNNFSSKDSNLRLTDNNSRLLDNFTLEENKLSLRDNYIRLIEKNLSAMNYHLNIMANNTSSSGIKLNSTDNNLSLTGNNLRATDNNSSLDENNMSLKNKLNSTDNMLSLTENTLRATDNNSHKAENNTILTDKLNSTGNKLNLTDYGYSSTENVALNLNATVYNLSSTENNISLMDNKLNSIDSKNLTDTINSTDNNYNSTEINLSATDNNVVTLQLSLTENNISLTGNKFSPTCNELYLNDNSYSLTENNLSAIEYNLSLTENNMSSTDNKPSSTCNDLNLTDNNCSLTENNLSETNYNLSLTENNMSSTYNKPSSMCNEINSIDDNSKCSLTENNLSVPNYNLSLTENNMSSTDNKSSSRCNEINYCSLTENNLSAPDYKLSLTENYIVLTEPHLNITENNMNLKNELNSTDNNLSLTENNLRATTNSNISTTGDNLSCADNNSSPTIQNEYTCSVCGVSFSTVFACRRHIASDHASSLKEHFFDIYLTEVKKGDDT